MPLLRKTSETNITPAEAQVLAQDNAILERIGGKREAGHIASMTKDDYWRRREERDIEKDVRISRSGVWQAALQSVGVLQYNLDGTLEGLLKTVEKAAEAGLQFINRK